MRVKVLAASPSRSVLMIGMPPATAASKPRLTPLASARRAGALPWRALSALFAGNTQLPVVKRVSPTAPGDGAARGDAALAGRRGALDQDVVGRNARLSEDVGDGVGTVERHVEFLQLLAGMAAALRRKADDPEGRAGLPLQRNDLADDPPVGW